MRFEDDLNVGAPPQEYFWAAVRLEREEVFQGSEFIEFVVEQHNKRRLPLPYSFVYTPDAFDVTGSIRRGAGVTCATFAINIFDRLRLRIVDLSTWRARPKQDSRFREGIIRMAIQHGFVAVLVFAIIALVATFFLKDKPFVTTSQAEVPAEANETPENTLVPIA